MADWRSAFPELAAHADTWVTVALDEASLVELDQGTPVFHTGSSCLNYLLVISGDVRVQMVTEAGRAATLYHVRDGNSCVLTTACLLGQTSYPAEGVIERPTVALAMSKSVFDQAMNRSEAMRKFVFENLGKRFSEVIARIEEIAFDSIDRRIARTLLTASEEGPITITHEELATEAGTVREVISRHLKQFEERKWLRLSRGRIEVTNRQALARLIKSVI